MPASKPTAAIRPKLEPQLPEPLTPFRPVVQAPKIKPLPANRGVKPRKARTLRVSWPRGQRP